MRKSPGKKKRGQRSPENYVRLKGSERHQPESSRYLGPLKSNRKFNVTIVLRRRPDGPPLPGLEYYSALSATKHQRLPPEDFADRYGADPADVAKVISFAESQGLRVVESHAGRRTVIVAGNAAQMDKAFGVTLGRYRRKVARNSAAKGITETYRGRDGFIRIPRRLNKIIVAVLGLDSRCISGRANGDPANTALLKVPKVTGLYSFPQNSAAGHTIAIFSSGDYDEGDLKNFFGDNVPAVSRIYVENSNAGVDKETTQDICIAGAAAPGAKIAVYIAPHTQDGWYNLITRVVHPDSKKGDPACYVLSASYFVSDGDDAATLNMEQTTGWTDQINEALKDAANQKVTFCAVSGDYGVNTTARPRGNGSSGTSASDGKAHVLFPGSSPWALCCGGTTVGNINGTSFDEYVWNDDQGATGGGISNYFTQVPDYQQDLHLPVSLNGGNQGRGVPDVAGNASPNSGYAITVNGSPDTAGGTSAVAPLYAGLVALINAALGRPVGFLNPTLYRNSKTICRDVNPYSTNPPSGPVDNSWNGVGGYPAGPGWDACTGLGSIKGQALLNVLKLA